jgi:hypothetical protein
VVSSFWSGFAVGAFIFSIVGTIAGIVIAAMCHAAANGNNNSELELERKSNYV